MKYMILESQHGESKERFEQRVNDLMTQGWHPIGGVSVSRYVEKYEYGYSTFERMENHYFQAMIGNNCE